MNQFSKDIKEVSRRSAAVPKILEIDLSIALTDQPYYISGNIFYVFSAPDESSYINIKINETREPAISFSVHTGLITPFDALYITTPAGQAGTIVLLYGTEAPNLLQVIDYRSTTVAGVGGLLEELRGDLTPENVGTEIAVGVAQVQLLAANANRKACTICSDILNTGNIYLGFDNTVTTSAGGNIWFHVLIPGASFSMDDYRGPIHAISTVAAQAVGVGEW